MLYTIETPAGECFGDFEADTPEGAFAVLIEEALGYHGITIAGAADDYVIHPSRDGSADFE
jgi:hypothetical protein